MKGSAGIENYPVGGIELCREGNEWVVRFENDGKWFEAFREGIEGPVCHTIHANGIKALVESEEGSNGSRMA